MATSKKHKNKNYWALCWRIRELTIIYPKWTIFDTEKEALEAYEDNLVHELKYVRKKIKELEAKSD